MTLPRLLHAASAYHLAIWGVVLATASCAVAQPVAQRYMLQSASSYAMLPGPPGTVWAPKRLLSSVMKVPDASSSPFRDPCRAAITAGTSATPLMDVPLPQCGDDLWCGLMLAPNGRLYYSNSIYDGTGGETHAATIFRVRAYVTPQEVAAFTTDPSLRLTVQANEIPDPIRFYLRLKASNRMGGKFNILSIRAPEFAPEIEQLWSAIIGDQNPNEPWNNITPDPTRFADLLLRALNKAIGNESGALSLYRRARYQGTELPTQIVKVIGQIRDLGGVYDGDEAVTADPTVAAADPWRRYRPKTEGERPAPTPPPVADSATINRKIALLNRMLIEYELHGELLGTLYAWVKDIKGYQPVLGYIDTDLLLKGQPHYYEGHQYWKEIVPMRVDPQGKVYLLLEPAGNDSLTKYYVVGPNGTLTRSREPAPEGNEYLIRGDAPRWVEVESEGRPFISSR